MPRRVRVYVLEDKTGIVEHLESTVRDTQIQDGIEFEWLGFQPHPGALTDKIKSHVPTLDDPIVLVADLVLHPDMTMEDVAGNAPNREFNGIDALVKVHQAFPDGEVVCVVATEHLGMVAELRKVLPKCNVVRKLTQSKAELRALLHKLAQGKNVPDPRMVPVRLTLVTGSREFQLGDHTGLRNTKWFRAEPIDFVWLYYLAAERHSDKDASWLKVETPLQGGRSCYILNKNRWRDILAEIAPRNHYGDTIPQATVAIWTSALNKTVEESIRGRLILTDGPYRLAREIEHVNIVRAARNV